MEEGAAASTSTDDASSSTTVGDNHDESKSNLPNNLTPDQVIAMLEHCDLSEEDTEVLLKDAYALNRMLKAHLLTMENSSAASSSYSRSSAGSRVSFDRQLSGPRQHLQSGTRRSSTISSGTRSHTLRRSADDVANSRLPPIRLRSPNQRLAELSRVYSSGVVNSAHRSSAHSQSDGRSATSSTVATSLKKRL